MIVRLPGEVLSALRDVHGFVNGMYGGDEHLHGTNLTEGSELCSAGSLCFLLKYVADYRRRFLCRLPREDSL